MPAIRGIFTINPDTQEEGIWIVLQDGRIFGSSNTEKFNLTPSQLEALLNSRLGVKYQATVDANGMIMIGDGTSKSTRV